MLQCSSSQLCCTILDVISSLYNQDNANYFILEPQNTMPQFAEKIYLKSRENQVSVVVVVLTRGKSPIEAIMVMPIYTRLPLPVATVSWDNYCGQCVPSDWCDKLAVYVDC